MKMEDVTLKLCLQFDGKDFWICDSSEHYEGIHGNNPIASDL